MEKNNYIYIENDSLDVYYNFALEYYLTSEKPFRDKTVFLIWRTTPTVMVGKFQNTYREINSRFVEENGINVVRRMSGGGTIFTDLGGWQFTFIAPAQSDQISFREYTEPVIEVLQSLGVDAYFDGSSTGTRLSNLPGLVSAGSSDSGLLVAERIITPVFSSNPSISVSS